MVVRDEVCKSQVERGYRGIPRLLYSPAWLRLIASVRVTSPTKPSTRWRQTTIVSTAHESAYEYQPSSWVQAGARLYTRRQHFEPRSFTTSSHRHFPQTDPPSYSIHVSPRQAPSLLAPQRYPRFRQQSIPSTLPGSSSTVQ